MTSENIQMMLMRLKQLFECYNVSLPKTSVFFFYYVFNMLFYFSVNLFYRSNDRSKEHQRQSTQFIRYL